MTDSQEGVRKETDQGITTLEFFHPKANSLPATLLGQLSEEIAAAGTDDACKVILLCSKGESTFCAGASFQEFQQIKNLAQAQAFFGGFARLILAMKQCPKFIVTKVQGKAVGGGVGIVAASDYAIATSDASIRLSEFELELGPFTIGPSVERKIGPAFFSELAIDCEWRDALWAKERGLYAAVCEDYAELQQEASRIAQTLATRSPSAATRMKEMLWQGTEGWDVLLTERAHITAALLIERLERQSA